MDTTLLVGSILTIVFGVPSYLALRKDRSTRILFIEEDKINLYDKVVKTFKELEIKYKGSPIKQNMFLLRGFFFCIGRRDITKANITKNISIDLSEDSCWHEFKIISNTKGLDATSEIKGKEIELDIPLLKNEDFLYLEALGESKNDNYEIAHRIANIPKVKVRKFNALKTSISSLAFYLFVILGVSLYVIIAKPYKIDSSYLENEYISPQKAKIEYDSIPLDIRYSGNFLDIAENFKKSFRHSHSYLYFITNKYSKTYQLNQTYGVRFYVFDRSGFFGLVIFISIVLIFYLLLFYSSIQDYLRFKKIYFLMLREIQLDKKKRSETDNDLHSGGRSVK